TQSVGPAAIIAFMTSAALAPLAVPGSGLHMVLAAQLAFMSGLVLLACGLLRIGFFANFFSRPVMSGFTIASAIVIAYGQLPTLLGGPLSAPHLPSAILGAGALAALLLARHFLAPLLRALGASAQVADSVARLAPMLVVLGATWLVARLQVQGIHLTGAVPSGLPGLNLASSANHWRALVQPALLIGFMVFLSSMGAAQSLALKRQEKLNSNYELIGLGAANLASAVTGGFPVTGSLSRSAVNFAAGANTPLATIIASSLLALALVAPTGWLALLPLPALAATIILAVAGMIDLSTLRTAWRFDRGDALALLATAGGVLVLGVEAGVIVGVLLSMGTLIWRASRPPIVVLGRIAGTEHFRNVERYPGRTSAGLLMLRIDANLFFGNVAEVQARVEAELRARDAVRQLVLVLSAVNDIDTTALFALAELNEALRARGIALHLAEVKGPVMDRLRHSDLLPALSGSVFLSAMMAWSALGPDAGDQETTDPMRPA
ncbi:MAG: SulP family inorganic anion transporter, partial [Massilia sp.]